MISRGRRRGERGATAIIVAIIIAVLLGFLGLALDGGHLFSIRGELQTSADAGALAGVLDLNGRASGLDLAAGAADNFARRHLTDSNVEVEEVTIELGHWVPAPVPPDPERPCSDFAFSTEDTARRADGAKFCRIIPPDDPESRELAALDVTAVRVQTGRPTPAYLGQFLGKEGDVPVGAQAVAVSGGPCTNECIKAPLAVRALCVSKWTCGNTYYLGLSSAIVNTAGWANVRDPDDNPNPDICDILGELRGSKYEDQCWTLTSYTEIETNNGGNMQEQCVFHDSKTGPPYKIKKCELLGQVFAGKTIDLPAVAYPDEGDVSCNGAEAVPFSGAASIKGFARFNVLQAYCDHDCPSDFAGDWCLAVQLSCEHPAPTSDVGCIWFGAPSEFPPKLML